MKRTHLFFSILMAVVLCLVGTSWAGEASVFDNAQKIIIRAYTVKTGMSTAEPPAPLYSAYIEIRDSNGDLVPANKLVVTPLSPDGNPLTAGTDGTYKIHDNDLSSADFSISFDETDGITYLICTNENLHVMKFSIVTLFPIVGACGTTLNACMSGTLDDIVDSGTNYLWRCTGANGGATADCSLLKPINGVCGTNQNVCTIGTLDDIADSSTNYLWNCTGANGGTTAYNCSLLRPINGVCGATLNACTTGTLNDIADSSTNYLWNCTGANGGTTANCSANIQSSGTPDLGFTMNWGVISGVVVESSNNNQPFSETVTIINTGTAPAGSFTVKIWLSPSYSVTSYSTLLYTWSVPGLAAGQSLTKTISSLIFSGAAVHNYYYIVTKVDADEQITESYESTCAYPYGQKAGCNTYGAQIYIYR